MHWSLHQLLLRLARPLPRQQVTPPPSRKESWQYQTLKTQSWLCHNDMYFAASVWVNGCGIIIIVSWTCCWCGMVHAWLKRHGVAWGSGKQIGRVPIPVYSTCIYVNSTTQGYVAVLACHGQWLRNWSNHNSWSWSCILWFQLRTWSWNSTYYRYKVTCKVTWQSCEYKILFQ